MINEEDKIIEEIFAKMFDSAKNVNLSSMEKSLIRDSLSTFMNSKPLPSPYLRKTDIFVWFKQRYAFVGVLVAVFFVLEGTTFAAQKSLPGDILYSVKINLNEKVESLLATTPKATAEIEVKHATTRLKEAEDLSVKGELTVEKNTEIKNSFTRAVDSINKNIKELKDKGDSKSVSEVNDKLENNVDLHYQAFIDISGGATNTKPFSDIVHSVGEKRKQREENKKHNILNVELKTRSEKDSSTSKND